MRKPTHHLDIAATAIPLADDDLAVVDGAFSLGFDLGAKLTIGCDRPAPPPPAPVVVVQQPVQTVVPAAPVAVPACAPWPYYYYV